MTGPDNDLRLLPRTVVSRKPVDDIWEELTFACGHKINIIASIGGDDGSPCHECVAELILEWRGKSKKGGEK